MLYVLHWTILDAADECADADYEKGIIPSTPFYYIFPISSITLFIYLLAPLCHQVKEADLQCFRLENGVKIWHAMWDYRHPDARCFTTLCKPRPSAAWRQLKQKRATHFGDVFLGKKSTHGESHSVTGSPPSQMNLGLGLGSEQSSKAADDELWVSSPKDAAFPETIPEESSSTEDEHVMIFRLPSIADSECLKESSVYSATDATLFHSQKRVFKSPSDVASDSFTKHSMQGRRQSSVDKESVISVRTDKCGVESSSAATILDVAVLRCLFIPQWPEEGVYWALQFLYHRLRDVPDTSKEEPEQRKRSNSLPNPQLKINFCADTDSLKKDKKEYIEVPEVKDVSPIAGMPPVHKDGGHFRRASEKVKKRMKMADLRAFVETKLLSKSEKHLEKLVEEEKKMFKDEHHRSLDHGDEDLTKSVNNFCNYLEPDSKEGTNLIKGKSMPSLRFIGDTRMDWVEMSPNPIITVTEHSPAPSPDISRRKSRVTIGSSGSQHESVIASLRAGKHKGRPLTRSVSDSKINYSTDDSLELAGSAYYITPDGDVDLVVVSKGIQSVALRDNLTCSLRVCEGILNVVEVVLGMGVLKKDYDKHGQALPSLLTSLIRVIKHLGCPQGCCADAYRGPPAEFLRSLSQSLLSKIYRSSPKTFSKYFRNFIHTQSITDILEFFHAYVGFCVDPSTLLSPLNQRRGCNKSPDAGSHGGGGGSGGGGGGSGGGGTGVFNMMGSSHASPLETHIVAAVLKPLVSKLVHTSKELKMSDNVTVYSDVRLLMNYIKEVHGNSLRRVAMSGLIDTAVRPHRKQSDLQTTRVIRHIPQSDQDDNFEHGTCYVVEERDSKKLLFKKRSTSSTCASIVEGEVSEDVQSPMSNVRKKQHVLTPRHSQRTLIAHPHELHKQPSRFHIGGLVNWLRKEYKRGESLESQGSVESPGDVPYPPHPHTLHHSYSKSSQKSTTSVTLTLQRARRRMEDQFTKFGFGRGKKKDGSLEETQGSLMSRRNSLEVAEGKGRDCEVVVLKARRLVKKEALYQGMSRLALLLDTCHPATLPHPHLLAASLDLPQAPVVSRAAFLLECAYFVHCCNKGQWPAWLKQNFPLFRPSGPPTSGGRPGSTSARRSHVLQRHAGNMFYQWAEAIGARLEEMLNEDKNQVPNIINMISDENKQKELLIEDEEEDFLDEDQVSGSCPVALRLVACVLLMEITAFLRETYQTLPKSCGQTRQDKPQPWVYNKDTNRRWSMALSSMGHSQASAQSLQSINDNKDTGKDGERKISFVLHEPDNESEGSSNTTVTVQGEEVADPKSRKQHKPHLLRRGTATAATGSFKRRSLKLRRTKDQMTLPSDPRNKDVPMLPNFDSDFKRSDSLQNKRKVSSLSDRSDTSEQGVLAGDVSGGEESPGVLSDEQPPESPTDTNDTDETANMPWLRVMVQTINSFNYYCSHQNFCHPFCHKRHMRAVTRLIKSIRQVYGEEFGVMADALKVSGDHKKDHPSKHSSRKVSEQTSPIKNKDSTHSKRDKEKDKLDRSTDNSSGHTSNKDVIITDDRDTARETAASKEKPKESPPILKYIKSQVGECFHCCVDGLLKGGVVVTSELLAEVLPPAWQLLLEPSQQTAASAAALVILASVKAPSQAAQLTHSALSHPDPSVRISAILRFQVLWKMRYQVWCRMEEGAQVTFKVPPPGIEFTLPSPKIGIESLPVVDPPWMPQVKTKVEEVQAMSQESHRSLVTATKTRKKQQTELIKTVLQEKEDKKRLERENFLVTSIPITIQAAHEPSLHHAVGDDHDEVGGGEEEVPEGQTRNPSHHIHSAQSLFPSCLCSAVIQIINLLDDAAVSPDGNAVYEVAYQVIWNCLVEDSALFLRYILERLTRDNQDLMFKVLRHLIRFVPRLPQQAAFTLYNYIIGYVMFYVRTPHEDGQTLIGAALSILWMVVHSVHGIMFKDLKQILRKEQCDASILLTANVPSTKKIIIEGPPGLCYASQFPVQEDTQFGQILRESLNYFIDKGIYLKDCFLVDHKTRQIHNPSSYVRDYYFFKRSHYPQLDLVPMHPDEAYYALQNRALKVKTVEVGKVLLTWAILKNVDMVVQRVVFLHEELMKLPSFPRKALEADLDLFRGGKLGEEILGMDVLHKFMWVRLIARMFEAMAGNFAYSGDIHLFLNVLNGSVMLHSQDATLLRYVMATYINAAYNFKNIFSLNGYLVIIPSLLQLYASHQTNRLVTRTVEYVIKQFYLMNRKPFILQMFGAVSSILDIDTTSQFGDAHKVPANCLFRILLSLETPSPDPLNIGELVKEEQPLRAIDFCYREESEMVTVLDCISLCVMVVAYAAESVRAYQMLTILEAIMPCYLQHIQLSVHRREGKTEREIISQLSIAVNTLISNCEALAKNYSGPQKTSPDHKGSSQRNYTQFATGFEFDDESHAKFINERTKTTRDNYSDSEDPEAEFRRPRDVLLSLVAEFNTKTTARLIELNKKFPQDGKPIELIDLRSQMRLADIAHSLLKASPYVPETMACKGLFLYMQQLMPATDWNNEAMRPTLTMLLRRIDKTFSKIYKKPSIRRSVDWDAASGLLRGVFETLARYPYIVHMQHFKTLMATCQALLVGESATGLGENLSSATVALMSQEPPAQFSAIVVKLIALQILAMGDCYTLEHVCGGGTMFPTYEKTENMLMNLLMPLCLRVGCGRKDVHLVREIDINYTLTVILNAMCPPSLRSPITMQNFKAPADFRTGSFSFNKTTSSLPKSLYQISFLALKIMVVCFETELECEWPRIARIVQELSKVSDARQYFWSFIDFVVEQRPPLFPILQPFIRLKLNMTPLSEAERHIHYVVRERLSGYCLNGPKCRGVVLADMANEMKQLKEDLANKKNNEVVNRGKEGGVGGSLGAEAVSTTILQTRHRPSIIDLLTGSQAPTGTHTPIHRESVSSISGGTSQDQHGINLPRNISSTDMVSPDDATDSKSKPRLQRSKAQSRKTFRLRKNRMESSLSSLTQREEREGSPSGRLVKTEISMEEDSVTSAGSLGSSLLDHGSMQHHGGSIQHHHPTTREVARSLSLDQKTTSSEVPFTSHLVGSLMEQKGLPLGSCVEHQPTDSVVDHQGQVSLSGTISDPISLSQHTQSKAKPAAVLHMSSEGTLGRSDSEMRESQHSLVMVFDEDTLI